MASTMKAVYVDKTKAYIKDGVAIPSPGPGTLPVFTFFNVRQMKS